MLLLANYSAKTKGISSQKVLMLFSEPCFPVIWFVKRLEDILQLFGLFYLFFKQKMNASGFYLIGIRLWTYRTDSLAFTFKCGSL